MESSTASLKIPVQFKNVNLPPAEQLKTVEVDPEQTVDTVRKQVQAAFNVPETQTTELIFKGQNLQSGKKFKEYNINKKDIVTVMPRNIGAYSA